MSTATAILEQARNLGVSLRVAGDKIKVKGPKRAVEQILPALRQYKPELLAALALKLTAAELDELARLIPLIAAHLAFSPEDVTEMRTVASRDHPGRW